MLTKIENLSEHDRLLQDELNRCTDSYRCSLIAEQAESDRLRMEANYKCIRLHRQEEYEAGLL